MHNHTYRQDLPSYVIPVFHPGATFLGYPDEMLWNRRGGGRASATPAHCAMRLRWVRDNLRLMDAGDYGPMSCSDSDLQRW